MRSKLLLVIVFLQTLFCTYCFPQNSWIIEAPLPDEHGRQNDLAFSTGTLGFIGLGYDNNLWCYDPSINTWMPKNPFPGNFRTGAFGFCIGNEIFFGGGNGLNDFWSYDTHINIWNHLNNLPVTVSNGIGFSIENKGYFISGNEVWEYDQLLGNWFEKNNFPGSIRNQATAITINNKGYLAFGKDETYGGLPDIWEYNPQNDSWVKKSDCPVPRFSAYGFSINNKGYFGGGYREWYGSDLSDFYEYDPSSDTWSLKNSPGGTYAAIGFSTDNETGYYGFGNNTCHIGDCSPLNVFKAYTAEIITHVNRKENDGFESDVFPNPSNNSLTINFFSSQKQELLITIINEFGQKIYEESKPGLTGKYVKTIDLSGQSKGIYFLEMKFNNERKTKKIILN